MFMECKKRQKNNIKSVSFPDECVTFDRHSQSFICDKYHFVCVAVNAMLCDGKCFKSNTKNSNNDVNM